MNLAPLADVVVYFDRSPVRLEGVRRAVAGRFESIWSPAKECVMATRALPARCPTAMS